MLDASGRMYGQGANIKGQLGKIEYRPSKNVTPRRANLLKFSDSVLYPAPIPFNQPARRIGAGKYFSVFLTSKLVFYTK